MIFAHVASEDEHRADAEAHGEETLIHRCHQCIEHSVFLHFSEIRLEIKLETFRRSFKRHAPDRQHDDQKKQSYHHTFGNSLETFLKPPGADKETENYGKERPSAHFDRICQQIVEDLADSSGIQTGKIIFYEFHHVAAASIPLLSYKTS